MKDEDDKGFSVHNEGNGMWYVKGPRIERLVSMASLVSDDSIKRLATQMRNMGIDDALREAGVQNGDSVRILDFEFEFID